MSSTESPLPEIATLVQQAILQQRFAESKEKDYVFREDVNSNKLNKDCTRSPDCLGRGPGNHLYSVLEYKERNFEIFWLDGIRVARVLPRCDGCNLRAVKNGDWTKDISISDSELSAENQRVEAEVAEAKAPRAQGKDVNSSGVPPQVLLSRMLELCTFSNPHRQVVEGRPTILLDFAWSPASKPANANEEVLKSFAGTVGIDEEDHGVQSVEGSSVGDCCRCEVEQWPHQDPQEHPAHCNRRASGQGHLAAIERVRVGRGSVFHIYYGW